MNRHPSASHRLPTARAQSRDTAADVDPAPRKPLGRNAQYASRFYELYDEIRREDILAHASD